MWTLNLGSKTSGKSGCLYWRRLWEGCRLIQDNMADCLQESDPPNHYYIFKPLGGTYYLEGSKYLIFRTNSPKRVPLVLTYLYTAIYRANIKFS